MPLSAHSKQALTYAVAESERLKHDSVGTEHLLLGLLRTEDSEASKILRSRGLDLTTARDRLASVQWDMAAPEHTRSIVSVAPVLRVADFERSVRWYRDVLGFEVHLAGPPGAATLRRDSVEIMLQEATAGAEPALFPQAGGKWDVYIRVRDVQAWRTDIQERLGVQLSISVSESRCSEFQFTDPDGHVIVFGEYAG
jgi:catechol 2,3-dioxygenase-like lactoylglutathione lyase family enzyme